MDSREAAKARRKNKEIFNHREHREHREIGRGFYPQIFADYLR
jgi:hypothetical protein